MTTAGGGGAGGGRANGGGAGGGASKEAGWMQWPADVQRLIVAKAVSDGIAGVAASLRDHLRPMAIHEFPPREVSKRPLEKGDLRPALPAALPAALVPLYATYGDTVEFIAVGRTHPLTFPKLMIL